MPDMNARLNADTRVMEEAREASETPLAPPDRLWSEELARASAAAGAVSARARPPCRPGGAAAAVRTDGSAGRRCPAQMRRCRLWLWFQIPSVSTSHPRIQVHAP